jgi:hypothetical protein
MINERPNQTIAGESTRRQCSRIDLTGDALTTRPDRADFAPLANHARVVAIPSEPQCSERPIGGSAVVATNLDYPLAPRITRLKQPSRPASELVPLNDKPSDWVGKDSRATAEDLDGR